MKLSEAPDIIATKIPNKLHAGEGRYTFSTLVNLQQIAKIKTQWKNLPSYQDVNKQHLICREHFLDMAKQASIDSLHSS